MKHSLTSFAAVSWGLLAAVGCSGSGDSERAPGGHSAQGTRASLEGCPARVLGPKDSKVHFHHVHFNTVDPELEIAFFARYYNAQATDFCQRADHTTLRATKTERGFLLYTKVAEPPDATPNTYFEHIGWNIPDPAAELKRLAALDAPFSPVGRGQCDSAAAGTAPCNDYWFYLTAPNGSRAEIAKGPGPATSGYAHVHTIMGEDFSFYSKISDGAFHDNAIDDVNMIDSLAYESYLDGYSVVETRGKPIDHIAYSTLDLEGAEQRIRAQGIEIAEPISRKEDYGFRSFFVKSPKGTWVELVEDSPFTP